MYFASNDNHVYAFKAETAKSEGELIWKWPPDGASYKVPGEGFHSFWPVLFTDPVTGKDFVVVAGSEYYRNSEGLTLANLDPEYFVPACHGLPGPPAPTARCGL